MTPQHRAARSRGATVPLLVFAALYLAPLAVAPSWWWVAGSLGLGAFVATGAWLIARSSRRDTRRPRTSERHAVEVTSVLEAVVLVVAVATGIVADAWWLALPLLLTAVALHILTLGIAYRRAVDAWSLFWITAATWLAWSFGATPETWTWPLCGSVAAGTCIGYVLALRTAQRRDSPRASPSPDVSVHESASSAT